jgi:hypothetical protein
MILINELGYKSFEIHYQNNVGLNNLSKMAFFW